MARPKKTPLERRASRLTLYFTCAELADLEARARDADRQTAAYARDALMKGRVIVRRSVADDRLLAALTRIGVNLNQLTRHVNSRRQLSSPAFQRLTAMLARIDQLTTGIDGDGA
jgi:hypothetical protein